jgi:hypothetical protein
MEAEKLLQLKIKNETDDEERLKLQQELLKLQLINNRELYADDFNARVELQNEYVDALTQLQLEHDNKIAAIQQAKFEADEKLRQEQIAAEQKRFQEQLDLELQYSRASQDIVRNMTFAISSLYEEGSVKQREIQKAGAVFMGSLRVQETIINGIAAVQQALATGGVPLAVITGLKSAAQIASIIMESGKLASFASGGYTGEGGKYQPAGIVHAGEYVLNQDNVKALGGWKTIESNLPVRQGSKNGLFYGGGFAETGSMAAFKEGSLIRAIKSLPAPVVTVEDINAVTRRERMRVEAARI